jgi:prepilin-type N-terminal cleavage/methylation domain-containing protein
MHTRKSGFSLVEMIVSVGLFSVVMLISTGAYLSLISLDRKARATNDLVTNLNFVIDTMERSLRSGSNFQCGGVGGTNCSGGSTSFTYVNDVGQTVTYSYDSEHSAIAQSINGGVSQQLTDPRVKIQALQFYVRGVGTTPDGQNDDITQPWVLFTTTGSITPDSKSAPIVFTIQSTAAARAIDL